MRKNLVRLFSLILLSFIISKGDEAPTKLTGPVVEAVRSPFIIVYSKPSDKDSASAIENVVETFRKELSPEASASGKLCKTEDELTPSDIENYNILLFTIFRYSSLLKQMRDKIPIKIEDEKISIGRREFKGDVGLIFICPNPLNSRKYLVVWGATNAESFLHITDFGEYYDDPIDYLVFTRENEDSPFLKVEAGIFDKEKPQWTVYPGSIPLDKVNWAWNSLRHYKGALRNILWNVIRCFPQDALVIYGTRSADAEENEKTKAEALKMQTAFVKANYQVTKIEVKPDNAVSEEELRNKNLVLFGTPQCNAILDKIKDKLPIKFKKNFIIAKAPYTGEWTGLIMGCPNPFNPEKYMLVYSGVTYKGIFYNVWVDTQYDYVIFKNSPTGPHGESADIILEVGTFDKSDPKNWKIKKESSH